MVRRHYVPVLHIEPVPARLRQLRVVVQELEQDAVQAVIPRPEPQHAAMSDQNRAWPTERAIHRTKKMRELLITFLKLILKNRNRVKLQILQFYINSRKLKRQHVKSVIILSKMVFLKNDETIRFGTT